jgi:hypothetical protein
MPRFHFHLRARGRIHHDADGTDFPDMGAAHQHASAVAQELMHHSDGSTRHWSICVEDQHGEHALDLFFADVDTRLAAYPPQMRMVVIETCRRLGALTDILCAARATQLEARMLIARARRKPQLAYVKKA